MSSFGLRVDAADVDWQIRFIEQFPEIAQRRFQPAMEQAVDALAREIEPNIPVDSGRAASEFTQRVSGNGLNLKGVVGWPYGSQAWYVNVVEFGAREHVIPERGAPRPLHLTGGWVMGPVLHPGFAARYFMRHGDEAVRARNDARFAQAREQTVQDMAVKA